MPVWGTPCDQPFKTDRYTAARTCVSDRPFRQQPRDQDVRVEIVPVEAAPAEIAGLARLWGCMEKTEKPR